jgi:hypothetical protein
VRKVRTVQSGQGCGRCVATHTNCTVYTDHKVLLMLQQAVRIVTTVR